MLEKPMGILLYGYAGDEARAIKRFLSLLVERDVMLIAGSGREKEVVACIIAEAETEPFEEKDVKILMFLGFNDNQMGASMKYFPVEKPIFCALTQENVKWTLEYLIGHLLEERARLSGQT